MAVDVADLIGQVLDRTEGAVHASASVTEHIAAASVRVTGSKDRLLVLAALAEAGEHGCTDPDLERLLEKARPTPGNRRGDLVALKLARKAYRTRPHPVTGNPCQVWRLTVKGLAVVTELGGRSAVLALANKS
jgi:hypothetical protein